MRAGWGSWARDGRREWLMPIPAQDACRHADAELEAPAMTRVPVEVSSAFTSLSHFRFVISTTTAASSFLLTSTNF